MEYENYYEFIRYIEKTYIVGSKIDIGLYDWPKYKDIYSRAEEEGWIKIHSHKKGLYLYFEVLKINF